MTLKRTVAQIIPVLLLLGIAPIHQARASETWEVITGMWESTTSTVSDLFGKAQKWAKLKSGNIPICTGGSTGTYIKVGRILGDKIKATSNGKFSGTAVETAGSPDNLTRMMGGECLAAIVQSDILTYTAKQQPQVAQQIQSAWKFYAEPVLLVCSAKSGVTSLDQLIAKGSKAAVDVGRAGSGSFMTSLIMQQIEPGFAKVRKINDGGDTALSKVMGGGDTDCILTVIAPSSDFMRRINDFAKGQRLVLASITNERLTSSQGADGKPIFQPYTVAPTTLPNLITKGPIASIAVEAVLAVLANIDPGTREALSTAVMMALGDLDAVIPAPPAAP